MTRGYEFKPIRMGNVNMMILGISEDEETGEMVFVSGRRVN